MPFSPIADFYIAFMAAYTFCCPLIRDNYLQDLTVIAVSSDKNEGQTSVIVFKHAYAGGI